MLVSSSSKSKTKSSEKRMPPMARPVRQGQPRGRRGRGFEGRRRDTIDRVSREVPRSLDELENLPAYSALIVVGGICAIGLGVLIFIFNLIDLPRNLAVHIGQLIVCLVFGFMLLWVFTQIRKNPQTSYILGIVFSIILFFGNLGGIIGGILGIIGSLLLLLKTERLL
jgi:hypothetical protein